MPQNANAISQYDFEGINLSSADFVAGPDEYTQNGNQDISAGDTGEVANVEIGEDGQLASYAIARLGDSLGPTGQSAQGKLFLNLQNNGGTTVDARTKIRFVSRAKNGNAVTALTEWVQVRDLDRSDPRQRRPFPPVTKDGNPAYVQDGRIIALEARNDATSFNVNLSNTVLDAPARGGY